MAPRAKKTTNKIESILVNGIEIKKGEIYKVTHKEPGEDAPEVYQELGVSKSMNPGVSNGYCWVYDSRFRRWDTGFYPESPFFTRTGVKQDEAVTLSQQYKDFILGEYNRLQKPEKFEDTTIENSNFYESEEFSGPLRPGMTFDTNRATDLMALYIAVLGGNLAPKGKRDREEVAKGLGSERDGRYKTAQYAIQSESKVISRDDELKLIKNKAIGSFTNFLYTDKKTVVALLNYEGIPVNTSTPELKLNALFTNLIEGSVQKVKSWNEAVDRYNDDKDKFRNELQIIDYLRNQKGYLALTLDGNNYTFNGKVLGQKSNFKGIARTIAENEEIQEEFVKKVNELQ